MVLNIILADLWSQIFDSDGFDSNGVLVQLCHILSRFRLFESTYYNFKNRILNKTSMNSIIEQLEFENTYVRIFLHVWKTKSKPL